MARENLKISVPVCYGDSINNMRVLHLKTIRLRLR